MDDKSKIYNIHLCRICQNPRKLDLIPTVDAIKSEGGKSCWETLKIVFCNIIWVEDRLISLVCRMCLQKVHETADFQQMCMESNHQREEFNKKYIELVNNKICEKALKDTIPQTRQNEPTAQIEEVLVPHNIAVLIKSEKNDDTPTASIQFLQEELPFKTPADPLKPRNNTSITKGKRKIRDAKSRNRGEPGAKKVRNLKHSKAPIIPANLAQYTPVQNPRNYETVCKICSRIFQTSFQLLDHIATQHKPLKLCQYRCEFCHIGFTTVFDLQQHCAETKHKVPQCRTPVCNTMRGQQFKPTQNHSLINKVVLTSAVAQKTTMEGGGRSTQIICMHCQEKFATLQLAKEHVKRQHTATKPFNCYKCNGSFITKELLLHHARSNHQFDCDVCPAPFDSLDSLLDHKRRFHETNRNNQPQPQGLHCFLCKRIFAVRTRLAKHIKSRACQKYGICRICGAIFHENRIQRHLMLQHNIKAEQCDTFFKRQVMTNQHYRSVVRASQCEQYRACYICAKFIHISQIRTHLTDAHNIDVQGKDFQVQNYVRTKKATQHELEHSYSLTL